MQQQCNIYINKPVIKSADIFPYYKEIKANPKKHGSQSGLLMMKDISSRRDGASESSP